MLHQGGENLPEGRSIIQVKQFDVPMQVKGNMGNDEAEAEYSALAKQGVTPKWSRKKKFSLAFSMVMILVVFSCVLHTNQCPGVKSTDLKVSSSSRIVV